MRAGKRRSNSGNCSNSSTGNPGIQRRDVLVAGAALAAWQKGAAQLSGNPAAMQAAISAFTGGRTAGTGRVALDIAPLVENGNTVPVSVRVESAMTAADHVKRIALFSERNPQPEVAVFQRSPLGGGPAARRQRQPWHVVGAGRPAAF